MQHNLSTFDRLFFRTYDRKNYNCLHFLIDAWKVIWNLDMEFLWGPVRMDKNGNFSVVDLHKYGNFTRVKKPQGYCLSLCRTISQDEVHFGTVFKNKMFHIGEEGVFYMPLEVAEMGFSRVHYYEYNPNYNR